MLSIVKKYMTTKEQIVSFKFILFTIKYNVSLPFLHNANFIFSFSQIFRKLYLTFSENFISSFIL